MRLRNSISAALLGACMITGAGIPASAAEQTGAAPLQLKRFQKTPVSSSATRTVKKSNGDYAQLSSRRLKKRATAKPHGIPEIPAGPVEIASEATNAYAAVMDAQVKVVSQDEVNEIDLAADIAPIVPVAVPTSTETVQVVGGGEINAIDRTADKETVGAAPSAESMAARSSPAESRSWVQRMIDGLHVVFSAATAAAKALFV